MENRREDILEQVPKIGDVIVFNPPRYKGLVYGVCADFSASGLPKVMVLSENFHESFYGYKNNLYTPKTGFVVVKDVKI